MATYSSVLGASFVILQMGVVEPRRQNRGEVMRHPIEGRPDPDQYIDDLRTRNYANVDYTVTDHRATSELPTNTTRNLKGIDSKPSRVLQWAVGAVIFMCGVGFGGLISKPDPADYRQPETKVEVRTTVVYRLPDSCQRALAGTQKYLESAAAIASANDKQLDIFSAAYQAILAKDWRKLNDLSEEQRRLESTLAPDTSKVLPNLAILKKDIELCTIEQN